MWTSTRKPAKTAQGLCQKLCSMYESYLLLVYCSRSALYQRFIPLRPNSRQAKKHKFAYQLRPRKSQNNAASGHEDSNFCETSIQSINKVASILGPDDVAEISVDDKSKLGLTRTCAKLQSPIMMGTFRVQLDNHDYVKGQKQCLSPSVYTALPIARDRFGEYDAVSRNGPVHVVLRSGTRYIYFSG